MNYYSFFFAFVITSVLSACSSQAIVVKPLPTPVVSTSPISTNNSSTVNNHTANSPSTITPNTPLTSTSNSDTHFVLASQQNKNSSNVEDARLLLQSLLPLGIKERNGWHDDILSSFSQSILRTYM